MNSSMILMNMSSLSEATKDTNILKKLDLKSELKRELKSRLLLKSHLSSKIIKLMVFLRYNLKIQSHFACQLL